MADDISHGDIYHKLGAMEGKLDAVIISVNEKRADIGEAFRRLRVLESRVAQGVILMAACALLAPLLWSAIDPELRFRGTPEHVVPHQQRS